MRVGDPARIFAISILFVSLLRSVGGYATTRQSQPTLRELLINARLHHLIERKRENDD
jgi:hypothetical protein